MEIPHFQITFEMEGKIMVVKTFQDLSVWQKSRQFVLKIYKLTKTFPAEERFGLTSQLQRAVVSVCANIAEGKKKGTKEYLRYLDIAEGSLEEAKCYLILSMDLEYCDSNQFNELFDLTNEIGRMMHSLKQSLRE
jgi:four helix bundle protein